MAPLLFLLAALGAVAPVADAGITGGWASASVTTATTDLLAKAMTTEGNYAKAVGTTRVCFSSVSSLETQVVAGTNYRFHVSGCSVSSAKSAGRCSTATKKQCQPQSYSVVVFEQTWTSTLQVSSIKAESSSTTTVTARMEASDYDLDDSEDSEDLEDSEDSEDSED